MRCKQAKADKKKGIEEEVKMILSINYGDIIATVHADDENYTAKIQGKMTQVKDWHFHQFVLRFMQSLEKASHLNGPV